ncbi:MAG: iron ABC transporter permease [Oscillospiraceae bacterium]|jgi:iron complex transport system permease protein|nr:iron ABC transporter permease [Oscillospiraceae bacterium]
MINAKEKKGKYYVAAFAILFAAVFVLSFAIGKYPISPGELLRVFFGKITGAQKTWSEEVELVIFKIRMPRVLAGAMIGAGLSAAGASYQGLFRNPMVSPDVLGASAGAGFGAAVCLFFGMNYAIVSLGAFVCGIAAVSAAYIVSTRARRNPTLGMVLAGIMISSLFTSGTSYIKVIADPTNVLPTITFWLMGSIAGIRESNLIWAAAPILGGLTVLFISRWKLNLLTVGDDEARSMGINTKIMRILIVTAATLITAACVAISGLIGWVGLVIPHFARMLVGYDYRVMMPVSMFMGASFMMLVDNLARSLVTVEIPLGILTAFVGAPFFLYLILNRGKRI